MAKPQMKPQKTKTPIKSHMDLNSKKNKSQFTTIGKQILSKSKKKKLL